jgi:predicted nucleotidyltransferase
MDPSDIEGIAIRLENLRAILLDLEFVILFGSTVKGRRRATSDVDIAARCANAADIDTLYLVLAPRLGADRVDIVDLRRAGPASRDGGGTIRARALRETTGRVPPVPVARLTPLL